MKAQTWEGAVTDYEKESLRLLTEIEKRLATIEGVVARNEQKKREDDEHMASIKPYPMSR